MTSPDDLDRALDDWLQDGPTRPPETPIDHALQHARAHPRRRDPLGFLRPDPMARRSGSPALRPALILASLGLLVVAAVAALVVGSPKESPAIVPPSQPAPSAAPSAGPSVAPSASPSVLHIELKDELNSGATVDVVDQSGTLSGARAAASAERAPDPGAATSGDVTVQNVDASTLWVSWTAGNCPDAHVLTIDPTATSISITQPPFCGGDTIGVGRQLVLSFSRPIDAASVTATLVDVGAASPTP